MKYKFYSSKLRIYVDDISVNKFKYSLDACGKINRDLEFDILEVKIQ